MENNEATHAPKRILSIFDAVCIIVGIVIGAGIFKVPAIVAKNTPNEFLMLLAWFLGGLLCIAGAFCYAELASAYPQAGGDYIYLKRAYGGFLGFAFVWARLSVIQTGSIVSLAYVFGDYMTRIMSIGQFSSTIYAGFVVFLFTVLNVIGVQQGKVAQNILTGAKVAALISIVLLGIFSQSHETTPHASNTSSSFSWAAFGLAMVFILYTYGGWNEAAFIAGEVKDARRNMVKAIIISMLTLIAIYMLVNYAYLRLLSFEGMRESDAVAADALSKVFGRFGEVVISAFVALSALGATNGTIFTGARSIYALGSDYYGLRWLGVWHRRFSTPSNALIAQGVICMALILLSLLGKDYRRGFENMVEYTAPVFWFFMLLTAISVVVLRIRDRDIERPFKTPVLPLTLTLFCGMCIYMLYSSLKYTMEFGRFYALIGVGVLLLSVPFYFVTLLIERRATWWRI
jgi:amino acid transporter